jgi:hypothetical protein
VTAPPTSAEIWKHCGFQRTLFSLEADENKLVRSLNVVIDIYCIESPEGGAGALKAGRVSYEGNLVPGPFRSSEPSWSISLGHSCNFSPSTASQLPGPLREFGPGACMTLVIQTQFGATYGQEL